ncbi:hypothetical protein BRADI_5g09035v3 [Brachypodium distachyon]|uniref:Uncharacterized protein n=1 Tax=Brachypodium distachyon TaxID=15368 RepID=A0A0Q3E7X9_BRADI|nr:hypothetical protein BRADI_5g09035v3 [Brachypodium distachyon]
MVRSTSKFPGTITRQLFANFRTEPLRFSELVARTTDFVVWGAYACFLPVGPTCRVEQMELTSEAPLAASVRPRGWAWRPRRRPEHGRRARRSSGPSCSGGRPPLLCSASASSPEPFSGRHPLYLPLLALVFPKTRGMGLPRRSARTVCAWLFAPPRAPLLLRPGVRTAPRAARASACCSAAARPARPCPSSARAPPGDRGGGVDLNACAATRKCLRLAAESGVAHEAIDLELSVGGTNGRATTARAMARRAVARGAATEARAATGAAEQRRPRGAAGAAAKQQRARGARDGGPVEACGAAGAWPGSDEMATGWEQWPG